MSYLAITLAALAFGCIAFLLRGPLLVFVDAILERCDNGLARFSRREGIVAFLLLAPAVTLLGVFGLYPLAYAVYLSLYDTRRGVFVGAGNYVRAWNDEEFWRSLAVTLYYALGAIPLSMAASFLIALLLFRIVRARGFFRTVYFLPYVTSAVAAATVWRVMLRPQNGFVNLLLQTVGIEQQAWLIEPRGVLHLLTGGWVPSSFGPSLALCCIVLFDVWHACGFMIVIFLAGLTAIPRQLEEAAIIDGARPWQVVRNVTLPLLTPTIFFLLIVSAVRSFQTFNSFYALTSNARSEDTQNLVIYIFAQLYDNYQYGYGAALAVLLCLAIVGLTAIQWRFAGRRVHYE